MVKQLLSWVILMQLEPYMCLWLGYLESLTLFHPKWWKKSKVLLQEQQLNQYVYITSTELWYYCWFLYIKYIYVSQVDQGF
jgi:hypothetical protein